MLIAGFSWLKIVKPAKSSKLCKNTPMANLADQHAQVVKLDIADVGSYSYENTPKTGKKT